MDTKLQKHHHHHHVGYEMVSYIKKAFVNSLEYNYVLTKGLLIS
jgi:hypothetical protein